MIGRVFGHYKIIKKIGAGSMGEVYLARDQQLEREVALKFLPLHSLGQPQQAQQFLKEAKAAAALNHPHIFTIHEISETDSGQKFLVMDHYSGFDLQTRLGKGLFPQATTLEIIYRLAHALASAHSLGIIHRDIKPANIMVGEPYKVMILDFGLAKMIKDSTYSHSNRTCGTACYMSPEQARGDKVDHRTDIWSLGVVMQEMLTGERPFPGDFPDAVIYGILNSDPKKLTRQQGQAKLQTILDKMLHKDPDQRYQTMNEVLDALKPHVPQQNQPQELLPVAKPAGAGLRWKIWALPLALLLVMTAYLQTIRTPEQLPFAGRKSVAVLPFENLTGDPGLTIWTTGLPRLIQTELGRSAELYVLNSQASQTVFATLGSMHAASLSPPFLKDFAQRTKVETLVQGSIMKAGDRFRVQVQLLDSETGGLMTTASVESATEDAFFATADSLASILRDYLEIAEIEEDLSHGKKQFAAGTGNAQAYRAFLDAYDAYRLREWETARVGFENALSHDPDYLSAQYWLVWSYRKLSMKEQMLEMFDRVQARKDDLSPVEQFSLNAMAAILDKDHWLAINNLIKLVDRDPLQRAKWGQLGALYLSVEEPELAMGALEQALALTQQWGDNFAWVHIYRNLAQVYVEQGEFDKAIEVARQGLDTGEQNRRSMLFWLSAANIAKNEPQEASRQLDLFRQELRSRGLNDVVIAMNVGLVHVKAGHPQPAIAELEEQVQANPEFFPAVSWLAQMHEKAEQPEKGVACLEQFLASNPDHLKAQTQLACLQVESGWDLDQGLASLEQIRLSHQDLVDAQLLSSLGHGYQQKGEDQMALAAMEESWQMLGQYDHPTRLRLDKARVKAGILTD